MHIYDREELKHLLDDVLPTLGRLPLHPSRLKCVCRRTRWTIVMVKACVRQNVTLLVIVQLYQLLAKISEHSGTWQLSEDREAWHASDVQLALAWYEHEEHTTVIKR